MVGIEVDDITQGMTKYLLSIPEVVELVGSFDDGTPWIFQSEIQKIVEGSQQSAIVVSQRGAWSSPNLHNSAKFPRAVIDIWVDPLRDEGNNLISRAETRRRAHYIFGVLDKHLHLPMGVDMMWGDVRVIASVKIIDFDVEYEPSGDGCLVGSAQYAISC